MNFGGPGFVLAIIGMSFLAWIITTAIRAKHGYPLEGEFGGVHHKPLDRQDEALIAENRQLKARVETLEERLQVLERIATDPGRRLSDEIDGLRHD